ncbi:MAG: TRAP transporter substrate-binding protein DctP [Treponema sp.]|nr:TRAP transporter substrate-binding protein DctP [Treponema sp.]
MNFINKQKLLISIVLLLFLIVCPLFAQQRATIVRLASLVPENTPWGQAINHLASEFNRVTNGEVEVIVFHNSTAGDEPEVLRKLRSNQIQAAVFTSMGMSAVMPEVMAFSYPFLIRNDAELDEVMRRLKPDLDARIQRNGFVTLAWVRAGWIKFFSRNPILTPDDLRRQRLATGTEDLQMLQTFRIMGYQVVPVGLSELLVALNSGRVDAVYQSPVYTAGNQIFGITRNMANMNVAPFMGGILMNEVTWRRIPDRYKPQLQEVCRRLEREIEASINNLETHAINTMVRHGLRVNELTPAQMQMFYSDTERYENNLVGTTNPVFNRDFYFRIKNILTEYRRTN